MSVTTGQSPKARGFALERAEKMIFRGLMALVRERDAKQAEINELGGELNQMIEERIGRDDVVMTGDGVTHRLDGETMQVRLLTDQERMQLGIFIPPEPDPEPQQHRNGTSKIRKHADADQLASELGITFPDGATMADKVAQLDEHFAANATAPT
jgi:hypothetical protein